MIQDLKPDDFKKPYSKMVRGVYYHSTSLFEYDDEKKLFTCTSDWFLDLNGDEYWESSSAIFNGVGFVLVSAKTGKMRECRKTKDYIFGNGLIEHHYEYTARLPSEIDFKVIIYQQK